MNLSELQHDAMIQLGETPSGHEFITPEVLDELLEMDLIYWRTPEDLEFTPTGQSVYDELVGE